MEPMETRRTGLQRGLVGLGTLLTALCLGAAGFVGWSLFQLEQVREYSVELVEVAPGEAVNYLLVATDSRENIDPDDPDAAIFLGEETGGMRSDTMLVARVAATGDSIDLISVPRDLWVTIAGEGREQRINTAYEAGDPQRLIDTVELALDIDLHHYIEVDFRGFEGLVDALGGVPMFFETPLRDTRSGLLVETSGCHVLDGSQALAFARSRALEIQTGDGWRTDGTGDLGRISRQQLFLRRALDVGAGLDLTDALALTRLIDIGTDLVSWDEGLDIGRIVEVLRRYSAVEGEALRTYTLPVTPHRTSGGAEVLLLERAAAQDELSIFRGFPPGTLVAHGQSITVLNGSGIAGQATTVADALREVGFEIVSIGDAPGATLDRTVVQYKTGKGAEAELVARHLGAGAVLVHDPAAIEDVVLITGLDVTTILLNPLPPNPDLLASLASSTTTSTPPPEQAPNEPTTTATPTTTAAGASGATASTTTDAVAPPSTASPTTASPTTEPIGYTPTGSAC